MIFGAYQNHAATQTHLSFTEFPPKNNDTKFSMDDAINSNFISLSHHVSSIFKIIPKHFTISTKNNSAKFNLEALVETSITISNIVKKNPQILHHIIDIEDDRNVLGKFEQLYQGEKVIFEKEDLPTCRKITEKLMITRCPGYMKLENTGYFFQNCYNKTKLNSGVIVDGLFQFMKNMKFERFTISTKKNKYTCNLFAVCSSDVIRNELEKNPKKEEFFYDIDDEFDDFELISKLFNFQNVGMTRSNMDSLKEISEDLQIKFILKDIEKYINDSEKVSQMIDDNQVNIDSIDEVFDWLYNIKEKTVDFVKNSIIESSWIETEENIQELAAFILKVIQTDLLLHPYLCDLLIQLNKEAKESNFLRILLPFIKSKLFDNHFTLLYSSSKSNDSIVADYSNTYAFIYKLYKNDIISKEEIVTFLSTYCDLAITSWFLPFIVQNNCRIFALDSYNINENDQYYKFMKPYLYDKIDLYEKMLDEGEPNDIIIKYLRHDKIDELQSIITQSRINVKKSFITSNIFDSFYHDDKISYLNYAAAYGSIKCFKYLLLNQYCDIDEKSFELAVFGGNDEIIKIVDQRRKCNFDYPNYNKRKCPLEITYSIKKHQNNLFDWILDKNIKFYKNSFNQIAFESAEQGNVHSLIAIIDRGYDISNEIDNIINIASKNGFYKLVTILLKIKEYSKNKKTAKSSTCNLFQKKSINYVYFGNLSIYKLFASQLNHQEIESSICFAISRFYMSIIDYFFEALNKKEIKFENNSVFVMLNKSLDVKKDDKLFNYLLEKFKIAKPDLVNDVLIYKKLIINACKYRNFEAAKTITNIILNKKQNEDFTQAFIEAVFVSSNEICQYFVDQKVLIDYENLSPKTTDFTRLNANLFSFIMNNANPKMKPYFLDCINRAIINQNIEIIEYLFNQNAESEDALIYAVDTENLDIVNTVLKFNSKPYFVNRIQKDGTALFRAVSNQNAMIVNRLLSIPKIDPSLYKENMEFPLIMAIKKHNLEIVNAILDFYGDDIQYQTQQLDEAVKVVFYLYCSDLAKKTIEINLIIHRILEIKYINPNLVINQIQNSNNNNNNNNNKDAYYDSEDSDNEEDFDDSDIINVQEIISNNQGCNSFLLCACKNNDIEMVKYLLKLDKINVNQYSLNIGDTPLLISIEQNNLEIAELLIKHPKTNINHRDFYDQTPLIIAVQNKLQNIIDLLIKDQRFDPDESRLNYAFVLSNCNIAKKLIELKSLDINYKCKIQNFKIVNQQCIIMDKPIKKPQPPELIKEIPTLIDSVYKTALVNATDNDDIEMINLIINHHSFDAVKSQVEDAIIISIINKNFKVFEKLIRLANDDVNLCDLQNQTLLIHAIQMSNEEVFNYIINNKNFDSKKSDILKAFVEIYDIKNNLHKANLNLMNKLFTYDNEHDHLIDFSKLLPNGKSFFTSIDRNFQNIDEVSNFLLEHGVDPNQPDKYDIYPLEKAMHIYSPQFALSLIQSNKIDFTVKFRKKHVNSDGYTTYLHMAAQLSTDQILAYLLDRDTIDVNITDDLGNTALMEACINKQLNKIDMFFKKDDLDYLHKNKAGDDALSLMSKNKHKRKLINTKKEYLFELKNCFYRKKYHK